MPESKQVDGRALDFVTHFVVPDKEPSYITGRELFEAFTYAWVRQQGYRGFGELLCCPKGRWCIYGCKKLMKARQVGEDLARPLQLHQRGTGKGESVPRLSTQAWTS